MSYIIYGYDNLDTLNTLSTTGSIIVIEPRKIQIDKFKKEVSSSHIKLITKALSDSNKLTEAILALDDDESIYYINTDSKMVSNQNHIIKRERIYTTSIINIISDYNIQNISGVFFNINVHNINNILTSIKSYNHIFSNIYFKSCVDRGLYESNDILNYFNRQNTISPSYLQDWVKYSHKNLFVGLPKICMFFTKTGIFNNNKLLQFIKKYQIDLVIDNKIYEFKNNDYTLPPIKINESVLFHKNMLTQLNTIFESDKKYDIIIAFNENILQSQPNFYILFPPNDDTLYINRQYDTIYSSKNGMYMLYQILHSNYFNEWIHEQAKNKQTLIKFFIKRWFYEYMSKTFKIRGTE